MYDWADRLSVSWTMTGRDYESWAELPVDEQLLRNRTTTNSLSYMALRKLQRFTSRPI